MSSMALYSSGWRWPRAIQNFISIVVSVTGCYHSDRIRLVSLLTALLMFPVSQRCVSQSHPLHLKLHLGLSAVSAGFSSTHAVMVSQWHPLWCSSAAGYCLQQAAPLWSCVWPVTPVVTFTPALPGCPRAFIINSACVAVTSPLWRTKPVLLNQL